MTGLRSVLQFRVKPGEERAFEAAFRDAGMLVRPRAVSGFERAELVQCVDDPTLYFVIGSWRTAEAYGVWQGRSAADAPREALSRLIGHLIDASPGRMCSVVASSDAETTAEQKGC